MRRTYKITNYAGGFWLTEFERPKAGVIVKDIPKEVEKWLDSPDLTEAEKEEWRESYRKSMLSSKVGGEGEGGASKCL